jgi:hypothetical protein
MGGVHATPLAPVKLCTRVSQLNFEIFRTIASIIKISLEHMRNRWANVWIPVSSSITVYICLNIKDVVT